VGGSGSLCRGNRLWVGFKKEGGERWEKAAGLSKKHHSPRAAWSPGVTRCPPHLSHLCLVPLQLPQLGLTLQPHTVPVLPPGPMLRDRENLPMPDILSPGRLPPLDAPSAEGPAAGRTPPCEGHDSAGVQSTGAGAKSLGKLLGFFGLQFPYLLEG